MYDNAAWFSRSLSKEDLTELAFALLGVVENAAMSTDGSAARRQESSASELLDELIEAGLSVDAKGRGRSLLERAIDSRDTALVSSLIERGADVNGVKDSSPSPLVRAVKTGSLPIVLTVLKATDLRLNDEKRIGSAAIRVAIDSGKVEIADALFGAGARPDRSAGHERPLLSRAGSAKAVLLLLNHGESAQWVDSDGNGLRAYMYRHAELAQMLRSLLDAGLRTNAKNHNGSTILNYAEAGDTDLGKHRALLVGYGARLEKADERLSLDYGEDSPAINARYRLIFADGCEVTGVTDIFGKTSWAPGKRAYHFTRFVEPSRPDKQRDAD